MKAEKLQTTKTETETTEKNEEKKTPKMEHSGPIELMFMAMSSKKFSLIVNPECPVEELKTKVSDHMGIKDYTIICSSGSCKLGDINSIMDYCSLHFIVVRVQGGGLAKVVFEYPKIKIIGIDQEYLEITTYHLSCKSL